jgi:hypothetical protein
MKSLYLTLFSNNTARRGYLGDASSGDANIYLTAEAGGGLTFGTNGINNRLFINSITLQTTDYALTDGGSLVLQPSVGNVVTGTADTKGYKFAVNCSTIATSMPVKLYANWPDYVFKKDYRIK